jgi:hypothetical protein
MPQSVTIFREESRADANVDRRCSSRRPRAACSTARSGRAGGNALEAASTRPVLRRPPTRRCAVGPGSHLTHCERLAGSERACRHVESRVRASLRAQTPEADPRRLSGTDTEGDHDRPPLLRAARKQFRDGVVPAERRGAPRAFAPAGDLTRACPGDASGRNPRRGRRSSCSPRRKYVRRFLAQSAPARRRNQSATARRAIAGRLLEGATVSDGPAAANAPRVQGPSVFAYRFDWTRSPTCLGRRSREYASARRT